MSEQGKAREFLFYSDANELNYHQAIEHCHKLQKENEALNAKHEKCKCQLAAIEICSSRDDASYLARQTLKEIKGE